MSSSLPLTGAESSKQNSGEADMRCGPEVSQGKDPGELTSMAESYWADFHKSSVAEELEKAFEYINEAISLTPDEDPAMPRRLVILGFFLWGRFNLRSSRADLDECIQQRTLAALLTPPGDSSLPSRLVILAHSFNTRFLRFDNVADLNNAIEYMSQAIPLIPENNSSLPGTLYSHGLFLTARFDGLGKLADLNGAIQYIGQAVSLLPPEHSDLPGQLQRLGYMLARRFDSQGELADLNDGIEYMVQAISVAPQGESNVIVWLNCLGTYLDGRYSRLGKLEDLERAIQYKAQAVSLAPDEYPELHILLNNLGHSIHNRFERLDTLEDLHTAIGYQRQAVSLAPSDHPDMSMWVGNLGLSLRSRYKRLGEMTDLDEAVGLMSQAVSLAPRDHPRLPTMLNNLGLSFCDRFERLSDVKDLHKAIDYTSQAVALVSEQAPGLSTWLNNLSHSYECRYKELDDVEDLEESIRCMSKAVSRTPTGHLDMPTLLNNFAILYSSRFERLHEASDLDKAIGHMTKALSLTPKGHPDLPKHLNNIGTIFGSRFKALGEVENLNKAIDHLNRALSLAPQEHSETPQMHKNLGHHYSDRSDIPGMAQDAHQAARHFQIAAESTMGSLSLRLGAALEWARLCAKHQIGSMLVAYGQLMALLPQLVWLESGATDRHKHTRYIGRIATEAAAAAIRMRRYDLALEWLEEGRSIVWRQMLQLRTPFDDLAPAHPALAEELKQVARDLDSAGSLQVPEGGALTSGTTSEETAQRHRRLTETWNVLVEQARQLPGFNGFLRPRRVSELTAAAHSGPVVVINVQKTSCDALVIRPGSAEITHIPLKFSYENATKARVRLNHLSRSRGVTDRGFQSGTVKPKDELGKTLTMLWEDIVMPVLDFLGYMQNQSTADLSHITWCPTGPLSFLPIHAAGDYTAERVIFNYVVSSYTPTLSALLAPPPSAPFSGILTVSQQITPDMPFPPGTVAELTKIQEKAKGHCVSRLDGDLATPAAVLAGMEKYSWVHLACHATQNTTDPLQSAFYLHNGMLDLASITQKPLKHAELAFLSACQTATGDKDLSEEAVHLAAGMLMAGYRTVIATMWSICDEDAPLIAESVYEHLMEGGTLDARRAAAAVHNATKCLREKVGMKEFASGDSYSTVSWGPTSAPSPSPAEPVGVEWPGVTSVGAFQANWVGYMTRGFNTSSLLAYDYAISGNNVTGFTSQVETFMSTAGQRPAATPWTADNAVFVSWIGINDVGNGAPMDTSIQRVIQQNQNLYALGARNFILINVPPTNRSPMGQPMTGLGDKIVAWNAQLAASALTFSVQNTDTSTLVFSSWDTFTKILDNPARYNISDPNTIGGGVWHDDLHPTGFVHYRLANDLAGYLTSLPAGQSPPPSSSPTPSRSTSTATGPFSITYSGIGIGTSTTRLAASAVYNTPSSTPSASSGWVMDLYAYLGVRLIGLWIG